MPLLSSLPAQAASRIGSSRIAAHFADIPKMQLVSQRADAGGVLDLSQMKGNLHFGFTPPALKTVPARHHGGSNGAGRAPDTRGRGRAMWIKPRPADQI